MTLLSETIKRLHLRPHSPYPSQRAEEEAAAENVRDMIKQWRAEQRCKIVRTANDDDFEGESV